MAWTTPITAVANAAFTAAQFNASVRDDLLVTAPSLATTAGRFFATTGANAIAERIPGAGIDFGATSTTGSTSYTSTLSASSGPSFTTTSGPVCLITIGCILSNSTDGANTYIAYAISGASTLAASDVNAYGLGVTISRPYTGSQVRIQTGMTTGSSTFTMNYRVSGGTGSYSARHIGVIPF